MVTGWFSPNVVQAETLNKALNQAGIKLDYVIEIALDRSIARDRDHGAKAVRQR